ncbi:MAG: tripartite tricarboxylate transporter permease [Mailhella sp.]|nr:tripartite tricarboxylate transporter permease [Mailhella sp.]
MFDLSIFLQGAQQALDLTNVLMLAIGSLVGIIVGILPGMGPMVGMVVLLPFSYALDAGSALALLLGVFCGGYFGGGIPSVLMRTPGVPSSLITSFDGFPLTQKGQSQLALSAVIVGSFGGGIISVICLIFLAPLLAGVAQNFAPEEYFSAALFGIVLVVMANRQKIFEALILLSIGLWAASVGLDSTTLSARYNFGLTDMQNGLQITPVCIGLFGVGQAFLLAEKSILNTGTSIQLSRSTLDLSKIWEVLRRWKTLLVSGIIGTFVGLLPGTGSMLASFLSYETARKISKTPEKFGTGMPEGCIASEAGNNAVPAGAMIPLLTLGIPGDAISAVLLGVFTINGIYPGPLLLVKEPVLINELYVSLLLINIFCLIMLILWLRPFAMIVKIPNGILSAVILMMSLVGIYSVNTSFFDIGVALVFGVLGYVLLRFDWPVVNLVMGVVLGSIFEQRLRESLSNSAGDPLIFFQRPISCCILIVTILMVVVPLWLDYRKARKQNT